MYGAQIIELKFIRSIIYVEKTFYQFLSVKAKLRKKYIYHCSVKPTMTSEEYHNRLSSLFLPKDTEDYNVTSTMSHQFFSLLLIVSVHQLCYFNVLYDYKRYLVAVQTLLFIWSGWPDVFNQVTQSSKSFTEIRAEPIRRRGIETWSTIAALSVAEVTFLFA